MNGLLLYRLDLERLELLIKDLTLGRMSGSAQRQRKCVTYQVHYHALMDLKDT